MNIRGQRDVMPISPVRAHLHGLAERIGRVFSILLGVDAAGIRYISFAMLFIVALVVSAGEVKDARYAHWVFSYEYEFIKRGFAGELVRRLDIPTSIATITLISRLLFAAACCVLLLLFVRPFMLERRTNSGLWLFFVLASLHSGTIQSLHFDIGRFDTIGLLIAVGCLWCIRNLGIIGQAVAVAFGFAAAMLIHEASFLLFLPMVLVYWTYREPGGRALLGIRLVLLAGLAGLFLTLMTQGLISSMSYTEYLRNIGPKLDRGHSGEAARVLFRDLGQNMALTTDRSLTPYRLRSHLALAILVVPTLGLLSMVVMTFFERCQRSNRDKSMVVMLIVSSFSPLLLYPIAHDHFRWWSVSFVNVFLAVSLLADDPDFREALATIHREKRVLAGCVIFASVLLGPLSITRAFASTLVDRALSVFG